MLSDESGSNGELKDRTKRYALRIIKLCSSLPKNQTAQVISKQILRSGTSVGANYRYACRARSKVEFASKLGIAAQELEETAYWLELLVEATIVPEKKLVFLMDETDQLMAMLVSSIKKTRKSK